jgi:hypothetical protein
VKEDQAMLFAALADIDVYVNIEDMKHSLKELRQDYTERFFTPEGLELLRAAGLESPAIDEP